MFRATRLIPVLCAALCACTSPTDPYRELDVTMAVDRFVAEQATPVEITINVVNRGSHTVNVADPKSYGSCSHAFVVFDSDDQIVPFPVITCFMIGYGPVDLAPGDGIAYRDRWVPGSVGRYRIVSRVLGDKNKQLGSKPAEVSVEVRAP